MNKEQQIYEYLKKKGWVHFEEYDDQISLLHESRTNENYLISAMELYGEAQYVLRLNLVSSLKLEEQADYELAVLQALRRSGVTPRPFYSDCEDCGDLAQGALFMEYLPGRSLNYAADYELAARTLAAIHTQPVDPRLLEYKDPIQSRAKEAYKAVDDLPSPRSGIVTSGMKSVAAELEWSAGEVQKLAEGDQPVIVHQFPDASDFIVDEDGENAWIVDWETGVVSSRYLDLAYFMTCAAHASEGKFCCDNEEKSRFLEVYFRETGVDISMEAALKCIKFYQKASSLWGNSVASSALAQMGQAEE